MPQATPAGKVCASPRCLHAGEPQPLECFTRNRSRADRLDHYCSACMKQKRVDKGARPTAPAPAPRISAPAPAPLPPLENAFAEHAAAQEKRDLKKEHGALLGEVKRLRAELEVFTRASHTPEILVYDKPASQRSDAVACALASDWHVEEPVDRGSVMGLNEYNLDVATTRARNYFRNVLRLTDMAARDSRINTLYLGILGDLFSGWIHDELTANTLLAPGDAAVFVNGLICSGIDFLLRESTYEIEVDALPGNHGRMTEKMHFGDPTGTSLETVMYHMIASRYSENPRVRFRVATASEVHVRFFERFKMRLVHGYEINYGGGVGGISIPLNKRLAQWNSTIAADLTCLGHFHQLMFLPRAVINGSLIGYNNYAKHFGFTYEPPQQAFFLIHARHGGQRTVCAPVWLDTEGVTL